MCVQVCKKRTNRPCKPLCSYRNWYDYSLICELEIIPKTIGLKLDKFSSYLSLRGLVRFTECCLLLRTLTNGGREHKTQAKKVSCNNNPLLLSIICYVSYIYSLTKAMKTLSQESKRYPVLKSRRLHLKAYQHFTNGYFRRARRCLSRAIVTAKVSNLKFEEEWATRNRNKWLGTPSDDTTEECDDVEFFVLI